MILLIDNYDSFSYNLYQYLGELEKNIKVVRNDEMTVGEIEDLNANAIVISPGPGRPSDAGVCEELVKKLYKRVPILGICLGHQGICEAFGAEVTYAKTLMHGKASEITIDKASPIFEGIPEKVSVARYHSLAVRENSLSDVLKVIAKTKDGEVMAVGHKEYPLYGLQFHPESIMTQYGKKMLSNFIKQAKIFS